MMPRRISNKPQSAAQLLARVSCHLPSAARSGEPPVVGAPRARKSHSSSPSRRLRSRAAGFPESRRLPQGVLQSLEDLIVQASFASCAILERRALPCVFGNACNEAGQCASRWAFEPGQRRGGRQLRLRVRRPAAQAWLLWLPAHVGGRVRRAGGKTTNVNCERNMRGSVGRERFADRCISAASGQLPQTNALVWV